MTSGAPSTGRRARSFGSWRDVLGADVRSLAVLRILLALAVLADLFVRSLDLYAFYTDAGILPRSVVLDRFAWLHALAPSVHLVGGSTWSQVALFGVHAVAALSMLVGFRTRLATFVVWLLVSSVQLRNLYIGAGVDALLRMLLLWSVFLPLGARWSVDRARSTDVDETPRRVTSVGTVALLVQVFFVYWSAGWAKWEVPEWRDGSALSMILGDDVRVTALGSALRLQPLLCEITNFGVLVAELVLPVLLFVPLAFGPLRTVAVGALVTLNAGIALTMNVGLFPFVASVGALALLPGWFWEASTPRFRGLADGLASRLTPVAQRFSRPREVSGASPVVRWVREGVCAVLLVVVVIFNVGVLRDASYRAPGPVGWIAESVFLQQAWKMFGRPATKTGWISIDATLADGRTVDLMAAGGPVPGLDEALSADRGPPSSISQQYANDRWRSFLSRAVRGVDTAPQLQLYGRYLCREWNTTQEKAHQMRGFALVWHARDVASSAGPGTFQPQTVWRHDCFG